jgi:hypothetical protein
VKKIVSLVVLACLFGINIGCDNAKPTTTAPAKTPPTTPEKK